MNTETSIFNVNSFYKKVLIEITACLMMRLIIGEIHICFSCFTALVFGPFICQLPFLL